MSGEAYFNKVTHPCPHLLYPPYLSEPMRDEWTPIFNLTNYFLHFFIVVIDFLIFILPFVLFKIFT
jgi:hypothetical protein